MPHHVVAAALVGPRGILLCHRRADRRYYPDCWDVPGGHVEPGESPAEALARELREEIGCTAVIAGEPALRVAEDESSPEGLVMDLWLLETWEGEPRNLAPEEHDALRWVDAAALETLELAHPSYRALLRDLLSRVP